MNIKDFRIKKGYSREQMSDKLKISISLYNKIEYDQRKPSQLFLRKFKSAFPDFDMNIFFTTDNSAEDDSDE